jgi:hypothetical protein
MTADHWTPVADALQHPGLMALYGVFAWFILKWSVARNKGGNGKAFSNSEWWHKEYDDILVSVVIGMGMVIYDDEFLRIWNDYVAKDPVIFNKYLYLLPGPITNIIYKLFSKSK